VFDRWVPTSRALTSAARRRTRPRKRLLGSGALPFRLRPALPHRLVDGCHLALSRTTRSHCQLQPCLFGECATRAAGGTPPRRRARSPRIRLNVVRYSSAESRFRVVPPGLAGCIARSAYGDRTSCEDNDGREERNQPGGAGRALPKPGGLSAWVNARMNEYCGDRLQALATRLNLHGDSHDCPPWPFRAVPIVFPTRAEAIPQVCQQPSRHWTSISRPAVPRRFSSAP
jgi:hypothetical protein